MAEIVVTFVDREQLQTIVSEMAKHYGFTLIDGWLGDEINNGVALYNDVIEVNVVAGDLQREYLKHGQFRRHIRMQVYFRRLGGKPSEAELFKDAELIKKAGYLMQAFNDMKICLLEEMRSYQPE